MSRNSSHATADGLAEVPAEEGQLPQEEHGGLELPVAAADAARGRDVEQARLGEDLQPADRGGDDDEDQGRADPGDRDREEAADGAGAVDARPTRRGRAAPPASPRAGSGRCSRSSGS